MHLLERVPYECVDEHINRILSGPEHKEGTFVRVSNGVEVENLVQAALLIAKTTEQFLKFEFKETKRKIILETAQARGAEDEVLALHGISNAYSPGLLRSLRGTSGTVSVPCSPSTSRKAVKPGDDDTGGESS